MLVSPTTTVNYNGSPFSSVQITVEPDDTPETFIEWYREWVADPDTARRHRVDLYGPKGMEFNTVIEGDFQFGCFIAGWRFYDRFAKEFAASETKIRENLGSFVPAVRIACEAAKIEVPDGKVELGVIASKPDGSGRITCRFEFEELLNDLERLALEPPDEEAPADPEADPSCDSPST